MEILRASLDVLFNEMNPQHLLRKGSADVTSWFTQKNGAEKRQFIDSLQRKCNYLTLDQCEVAAELVKTQYLNRLAKISNVRFAPSSNIFNALLHFSGQVLKVNGTSPVCRFEHLLRWSNLTARIGEDLLTTSFLASYDLMVKNNRTSFDWDLVIGHDEQTINKELEEEMADVHMHLNGSSSNFDLGWLSLMLFPKGHREDFKDLKGSRHQTDLPLIIGDDADKETCWAVKACMIRYYLFYKFVKQNSFAYEPDLMSIIFSENAQPENWAEKADSWIKNELLAITSKGLFIGHDYINPVTETDIFNNPNSLISGERFLLYSCFRDCYSGKMSLSDTNVFYAYLIIKNRIRNMLIQTNSVIGFQNFDSYEKQKTRFIKDQSVYEKLVEPLAIGQYFYASKPRYVEARITPKGAPGELSGMIKNLDNNVQKLTKAKTDDYHYVFHFIKKDDQTLPNNPPVNARHNSLRDTVRKQAIAINAFRGNPFEGNRVVGIDAANSEISARPEVFAQAFRFLRGHKVKQMEGTQINRLGITYHAGEDYLSPLDGLRAIDEVLHYMDFVEKDRLGHAIVLGIDPKRYYQRCHHTLLLPKIVAIDNFVWCLHRMKGKTEIASFKQQLEEQYERIFKEVYGQAQAPSIQDYYQSWLLRGDNPENYETFRTKGTFINHNQLIGWPSFNLNASQEAQTARENNTSVDLFYRYHFDFLVRKHGQEIMEVKAPKGFYVVVKCLQDVLIDDICSRGISIEANPTSNYRIGDFERYLDLPIINLYPTNGEKPTLSFSVNTDDRGVFATSLEREYSLLACALSKGDPDEGINGSSNQDIVGRLQTWRGNSIDQKFINRA